MPSSAFQEFRLYEAMEPFGERGGYQRTGILASTLANIHRGENQKAYTPADFMPLIPDTPSEELTPEAVYAKFRALAPTKPRKAKPKTKRARPRPTPKTHV